MSRLKKTIGKLIPVALIFLWAAIPGQVWGHAGTHSTVAEVCAHGTNSCAGGVADINEATVIATGSTLEFESDGFPTVNVNAGGSLDAEDVNNSQFTMNVGDLTVKSGGKITVNLSDTHNPGKVTVNASGTINVHNTGIIEAIGGTGPGINGFGPTIELFADGNIDIAGRIFAKGTKANGRGGRILIESFSGKVTIQATGRVEAHSEDPGHTFIKIRGCKVEIFGLVDATAKKRGAEVHIVSQDFIKIIGGQVLANLNIGELPPGTEHRIVMEARDDIILENATVQANAGSTDKKGGNIIMLSLEGEISMDVATSVQANATAGGSDGGTISVRSFGDLTYKGTTEARGNNVSGVGGTILFQSFDADVKDGTSTTRATGNTPGSITLRACANPITNGGTFDPAKTEQPGNCDPVPTSGVNFGGPGKQFTGSTIPPCTGCFCLDSIKVQNNTTVAGNDLTIKGKDLKGVEKVEFNSTCALASGCEVLKASFISQTDTQIKLDLPACAAPGDHVILSSSGGPSSSCSNDLLP